MKKLVLILLGAFAAFMALAILQEWRTFGGAWFSDGAEAPPELEESERKAAADAVYLMLSLIQHYYASDGDPRFADRMPASPAVVEELAADVEYLLRNHRRQDPSLERLEVIELVVLAPDRVEVRTREWWQIHTLRLSDGQPSEPVRRQTLAGSYMVTRQDQGWRVEGWDSPDDVIREWTAPTK